MSCVLINEWQLEPPSSNSSSSCASAELEEEEKKDFILGLVPLAPLDSDLVIHTSCNLFTYGFLLCEVKQLMEKLHCWNWIITLKRAKWYQQLCFSHFVPLQSRRSCSALVDFFPQQFFPSSQAEALAGCCQERQIQFKPSWEQKKEIFLLIQPMPKDLLTLQVNENGFLCSL